MVESVDCTHDLEPGYSDHKSRLLLAFHTLRLQRPSKEV
jgi:hypothetical protein